MSTTPSKPRAGREASVTVSFSDSINLIKEQVHWTPKGVSLLTKWFFEEGNIFTPPMNEIPSHWFTACCEMELVTKLVSGKCSMAPDVSLITITESYCCTFC